jgi:nucleoside-diphosphate-sugar epimerase
MRIFITGASGFIGSYVTRAFLDAGHQVLALAFPEDNLWRIQDLAERITVLHGNLEQIENFRDDLRVWKPDACVHLAWYVEPGTYLKSHQNLNSLQASIDLLKELFEGGCQQFVGAGTCAEYELKPELISESDTAKPETLYAATKLSFKLIGEQLAQQYGRKFAWGRIFYLYGPNEDKRRLVPAAILKLLNSETFPASPGEQMRDFLHVADVASAFLAIVERNASGTYNISSAEPISVRNLLNTIEILLERSNLVLCGALPYREWEPMFVGGNNARLKSIGWLPQYTIQSGLNDVVDWWKKSLESK